METSCVIWSGHIRPRDGYGIHWSGRMAHRVIYEREVGPIPDGLELDHLCGTRACVAIDHLEPVTRQQNIDRQTNAWREKSTCPKGHTYDESNTMISGGKRYCKECRRQQQRARRRAQTTCQAGHPFDRVNARGSRYCSICQAESGRTAMASRWGSR